MHLYIYTVLQALVVIPLTSALPSPAVPYIPAKQGITLRPIAIRDYEAASGLQRREQSEDPSDLDLQPQLQMMYGSPGSQHAPLQPRISR